MTHSVGMAGRPKNDTSRGFIGCMMVFLDERPTICFGAQKRPSGETHYTYILLFAPDAPKAEIFGFGKGNVITEAPDHANIAWKYEMGNFVIDMAYAYKSDKNTLELTSEKLTINGEEYATETPPVFLVGTDGKLKRVFTKAKTVGPELDIGRTQNPTALLQTIEELKKDSQEIAAFLTKK
ncbi:hypothetical protein [Anatilimnocola floriformis]|uniref:hypothetical protein n=1 Tax=Anatilimnocola floriformis TaxID=2948575 RepID=UPI0020C1E2FB|nr:hypothetical protein [Anatilimnocola floriformis]